MDEFSAKIKVKTYKGALLIAIFVLQIFSHAQADSKLSNVQRRAEQGDATAQYELGGMYTTGKGVPQDAEKALIWYRKAASQGNAGAQSMLGAFYGVGEGIAKDAQQAVFWYRKAAENGDAIAQGELGKYYARGEGVPQNYSLAYTWLSVATANGAAHVMLARDMMKNKLSSLELSAAQKLAEQYFEKYRSR